MLSIKRSVCTGLVAAALVAGSAGPSFAAGDGKYSGDGVNIRRCSTANSSCPVLGQGQKGQRVDIKCVTSGTVVNGNFIWLKHKNLVSGITGFSSGEYIDPDPNTTAPGC